MIEDEVNLASSSSPEAEQESEPLTLIVAATESGTRLDQFLTAHIPHMSRARLKRLIEDGEVSVEGRTLQKPGRQVRAGEHVEVELTTLAPPVTDLTPENIPLEIVYEDDDLAVINKPAGMVVHPGAGVASGTLVNALAFHFRELSPRGGYWRPGLVHRLDRDTSGLMVVAKTEAAHEHLADQFRLRQVFKSYRALVHGRVRDDQGEIAEPLGRDPRARTRMTVVRGGRPALTLYRAQQRFERFTLLEVQIKTGRTHQIRVHMAWIKHPVVGDKTYGLGRDETIPDPHLRALVRSLGRQFLHAEQLGFHHPRSGQWLSFKAPLPGALAEFLSQLKK